jgi:hypothetical protein
MSASLQREKPSFGTKYAEMKGNEAGRVEAPRVPGSPAGTAGKQCSNRDTSWSHELVDPQRGLAHSPQADFEPTGSWTKIQDFPADPDFGQYMNNW